MESFSDETFKNLTSIAQEYATHSSYTLELTKGEYYILRTQLGSSNVTVDFEGAEVIAYCRDTYHMALQNCLYIFRATSDTVTISSSSDICKQIWQL